MRLPVPSSHAKVKPRFAIYDLVVAAFSPYLALYLRNSTIISNNQGEVVLYCLFSLLCTLVVLWAFHIERIVPRYFSLGDALNLAKAVVIGELLTAVGLFSFTRLDGVPRSVPAIHALMLAAGLVAARAFVKIAAAKRQEFVQARSVSKQNVILIGMNDLSVLFARFLEAVVPGRWQVIALLDEDPRLLGRLVHGVRIYGHPGRLAALIDEFMVHGVRTDRVILGDHLDGSALQQIQEDCARCGADLAILPDFFSDKTWTAAEPLSPDFAGIHDRAFPAPVSRYFRYKARVEFLIALAMTIIFAPLLLIARLLALIDGGFPIFFWQRRLGRHGQEFQIYKIRTLKFSLDKEGLRVPEEERLSRIGRLLRRMRLDELPQLFNVIVGDMALVGPRPLLSQDQPSNPAVRLAVRPGLTGWAQVNGGTFLSAEEKDRLDAWYVQHASLWLDFKIIGLTLSFLIGGDRRSLKIPRQAGHLQPSLQIAWREPRPDKVGVLPRENNSNPAA